MLCVWYCKGKQKILILPDRVFSGGTEVLRKIRRKKKNVLGLTKPKAKEVSPGACLKLQQI